MDMADMKLQRKQTVVAAKGSSNSLNSVLIDAFDETPTPKRMKEKAVDLVSHKPRKSIRLEESLVSSFKRTSTLNISPETVT